MKIDTERWVRFKEIDKKVHIERERLKECG